VKNAEGLQYFELTDQPKKKMRLDFQDAPQKLHPTAEKTMTTTYCLNGTDVKSDKSKFPRNIYYS
jgi:hypothetical protein